MTTYGSGTYGSGTYGNPLAEVAPTRDLAVAVGRPVARWITGSPIARWITGRPQQ